MLPQRRQVRGRAHDSSLPKEGLSSVWNSKEGKVLWADWFFCPQTVFLDQRRTLKDGRDLDGWRDMDTVFRGIGSRVRHYSDPGSATSQ